MEGRHKMSRKYWFWLLVLALLVSLLSPRLPPLPGELDPTTPTAASIVAP